MEQEKQIKNIYEVYEDELTPEELEIYHSFSPRVRETMTLNRAIREILKEADRPLNTQELAIVLYRKYKYKVKPSSFKQVLYLLKEKQKIKKVKHNLWSYSYDREQFAGWKKISIF